MRISRLLFSFDGRINRRQFGFVFLGIVLLSVGVSLAMVAVPGSDRSARIARALIYCVPLFPLFWALLAASVKRWHDMNLSGMMMLLWLIPFVGGLIVLVCLGFGPGVKGRNKYGRDPSDRRSVVT